MFHVESFVLLTLAYFPCIVFSGLTHVTSVRVLCLFRLNDIQQCVFTTSNASVHLLIDIWVVSSSCCCAAAVVTVDAESLSGVLWFFVYTLEG